MMKAIVLAGGLGKRLRPLTFAIPKPLIPVGEKPILEHLIEHLKTQEVREVILAVGYRAELIETYFGDGARWGIRISYHHEASPMGTAGPLRAVRDDFDLTEPFLVMNADILTNVNLERMFGYHRLQDAHLTVGWREHAYRLPYGCLEFREGMLSEVREKPEFNYPTSAGIYVVSPRTLDEARPAQALDMPDLINRSIRAGLRVAAYQIKEEWRAIENLGDLEPGVPAP
ncbi:MAG: NTP transferase domain-containing protein [Acidobacteria bacterium]|nr:NTP transferase domain-containing protein [Acidobacteriota bacterium]